MKKYTVTTTENLRNLCIKNNWFTCGTNEQYEKLFYANEHGCPIEEIATIIWLCSDTDIANGGTCRSDILFELGNAHMEFWKNMFGVEDIHDDFTFYSRTGYFINLSFEAFMNVYFEKPEFIDWENGYTDMVKIINANGETIWERGDE